MMLNRKFSIIVVAITVLVAVKLFYPQKKCSDYTQEAVIEAIKSDFINNRMARWTEDPEYLGTRTPDILIDNKEVSVSDVYLVPFTAKGAVHEKKYFAIYACNNGSVEYSTNGGG